MINSYKDASKLYEVERRLVHAEREGFRISELTISSSQKVPWHYHSCVKDTFYLLEGELTIYLRDPKETKHLDVGESYVVEPKRPHLVVNAGAGSANFLVLQGMGEYDFIPIT